MEPDNPNRKLCYKLPLQDDEKFTFYLGFSGGLEKLAGKKRCKIVFPEEEIGSWNLKRTIKWVASSVLREQPELFMQDDTVRPGILVFINDTDWELLGNENYIVQPQDNIVFISTLHGG